MFSTLVTIAIGDCLIFQYLHLYLWNNSNFPYSLSFVLFLKNIKWNPLHPSPIVKRTNWCRKWKSFLEKKMSISGTICRESIWVKYWQQEDILIICQPFRFCTEGLLMQVSLSLYIPHPAVSIINLTICQLWFVHGVWWK